MRPAPNRSNYRVSVSTFRFRRSVRNKPCSANGRLPVLDDRPDILLASPYVCPQTLGPFREQGGATGSEPIGIDEHLREKEFGILDGLTTGGVASVYRTKPSTDATRQILTWAARRGKQCNVIFRLRQMATIALVAMLGRKVHASGAEAVGELVERGMSSDTIVVIDDLTIALDVAEA